MTTAGQAGEGTGEKLYAGKFKTVEELENGYNNSAKVYQENETLKKRVDELAKVPDEYMTPSDVILAENQLSTIKTLAKSSGLTQVQYEKLAKETFAQVNASQQSFENAKKEAGADNINLMQDFLKKQYGEKVGEVVLRNAILNKELREEVLAQRTASLNSSVPGMNRASTGGQYHVTKKDVLAARDAMNAASGKAKVAARDNYLALQKQIAHQKNA